MTNTFAKHQFKYTFNGSDDAVPVEITFEVAGDSSLSQMIEQFEYYLKACGFHFKGRLDFVDEEPDDKIDTKYPISSWDDEFRSQGPEFIEDKGNAVENCKKEGKFVGKENVEAWDKLQNIFK